MASHLIEVCNLLVDYNYGPISRQIFTHLAQNGRSHLGAIRAACPRTPLPRLKRSLVQLIQHRLVLHHTDLDTDTSFYSVDWQTAYGLIRNGRVVTIVQERYGAASGNVVAMLLQVGHCTIGDLAGVFNFEETASKRDSGIDTPVPHINGNGVPNGVHKEPEAKANAGAVGSLAELHFVLRKLLRCGLLMKVGNRSFKPQADIEAEVEEVIMEESFPDRKITGPKKQAEFKRAVEGFKRKWRDDAEYSEKRDIDGNGTIKRPGMDAMNANKRQKLNGGHTNGNGAQISDTDFSGPKLPNDMSISVNLTKCTIAMRSEHLVRYATENLGPVTGEVYRALLTALESKVRTVREDLIDYDDEDEEEEAQPVASILEIAELVPADLDLAMSINGAKSDLPNGGPKAKKKTEAEGDDDFTDIGIKKEADSDDEGTNGMNSMRDKGRRLDLIEQHLKLMEEHEKEFCRRPGPAGQSEWRVNFPLLTREMINNAIDTTIDRRFGKVAVRIARMLREEGKLEEKLVAQKTLKHVKDIRSTVVTMQAHGFLEAQEIPKDNYRQPSRSLYLWYFDEKKVQQMILYQSYQGMARCLQRMEHERENFQTVLDKRARLRSDNAEEKHSFIMGKSGMLEEGGSSLNGVERAQLGQWRDIQEKLLAQVGRIDDLVAVMRDFTGKDVSMIS